MLRLKTSVALVALLTAPAMAADWSGEWADMRGGYTNEPKDWSGLGAEDDSLTFEFGVRYWYSQGAQNFELGEGEVETEDNAHSGELHLRIDDAASRTYAKAAAGYTTVINGSYTLPEGDGSTVTGELGYAGGDFGWHPWGDENASVGGFVGYQYWNDSPRTERDNYATVTSADDVVYSEDTGEWSIGFDGVERHLDVNALRLGMSGRAKFGMVDLSGEIAAVPYATVTGIMGGFDESLPPFPLPGCGTPPPGTCEPYYFTSSPITVNGTGYGAMGELMAGITPWENLTFRAGGRAWYLQGTYDAEYSAVTITPPQIQPEVPDESTPDPDDTIPADPLYGPPIVTRDDFIATNNPFSMFRYGLLAEFTYSF